MSQKNTLFKYFGSPTPRKNINEDNNLPKTPKSDQKRNLPKKQSSETPPAKRRKLSVGGTPKNKSAASASSGANLYDVVWSKLDGYPWWPGLVCNHPKHSTHTRDNEIHVQFFDEVPSRAWIRKKYIEPYHSSKDKPLPSRETEKWIQATDDADRAVKSSLEERKKLLIDFSKEHLTSDEEEDSDADASDTDKENFVTKKVFKKICIVSDSEDDYKPVEDEEEADEESDSASSGVDSALESGGDSEEEVPESPKKKRKRGENTTSKKKSTKNTSTLNHSVSPSTKAKLTSFDAKELKPSNASGSPESIESWTHLKLEFLKPQNIRDGMRRPPDHPDYDPKTLYVPENFKNNLSPAMKQWWEMKAKHFDCVLFFKVGKFYELYHMDAVIGVNELGLMFMKGEFAHSGFPEIAYGRFSGSLVEKGYKIARIEQTETPDMMNERCKALFKATKFDKVVKREICQITTKGTQTFSVQDGEAQEAETKYLLALTEQIMDASSSCYGVCFIDTSIGVFHLGQFTDDRYCSRLRTMIAHHPPVQVLYERNVLSERTRQLMGSVLATVLKESLASGSEFWPADKTLVTLAQGEYFPRADSGGVSWPEALKAFLNEADSLGLSARDECELAVRALGACVWYLKECHLEQQLLALGKFEEYQPIDKLAPVSPQEKVDTFARYMILDGTTLQNLDILESCDGEKGSLLKRLDFCCTPFGKRLLRQWVCSPLCDVNSIKSRQAAVAELLQHSDLVKEARAALAGLPDLERLLAKIHAQGNVVRSKTHPDSRAIFYEDHVYSKRKILDFIATLNGFKASEKIAALFRDTEAGISSKLLLQCTGITSEQSVGKFPDMSKSLAFFDNAFDHEEAEKEGRIIPSSGVDPEYDAVLEELKQVNRELQDYLEEQKRYFGCKVSYFGTEKKRFQLEVPDSAARKAQNDYELQSQKKGYKRYWTSKTKELLARQIAAETQKTSVLKDLNRRIFEQFSAQYDQWSTAVQCLAVLDVLLSLTEYTRSEEGDVCVPQFVLPSENVKPFVNITDGRHPCIASMDGFIPNDTIIGCKDEEDEDSSDASLVLVTGPNMGGKSTLMRQLGLIIVMAQMGCHIPAVSCKLTPVDRIFTRLGASDDIMAGESTFYVELSETSAIFHQATRHSLVLVDELGRGTSTYDGTAIAAAVVRELAQLGCRTLFSTHYHTLVEDFKGSPNVTLGHMACMVENEEEGDPSQETVTFLYKFAAGACPKSYGFNAARLGGIPNHIITEGHRKAVELEKEGLARKLFRSLLGKQYSDVSELLTLLKETRVI